MKKIEFFEEGLKYIDTVLAILYTRDPTLMFGGGSLSIEDLDPARVKKIDFSVKVGRVPKMNLLVSAVEFIKKLSNIIRIKPDEVYLYTDNVKDNLHLYIEGISIKKGLHNIVKISAVENKDYIPIANPEVSYNGKISLDMETLKPFITGLYQLKSTDKIMIKYNRGILSATGFEYGSEGEVLTTILNPDRITIKNDVCLYSSMLAKDLYMLGKLPNVYGIDIYLGHGLPLKAVVKNNLDIRLVYWLAPMTED